MVTVGKHVYGLGAVVLGVTEMAYGAFAPVWLPVPEHMPGYHLAAYASAGFLILAGLAANAPRMAARAALALAAFFALSMLVLELPPALMTPTVWGGWQAVAESTAMALGGVLVFVQAPGSGALRARLAQTVRPVFGGCLLIFGVSHFIYAKFTASMVPAWLPPSQMIWAYATGLAQLAAGLALWSGIKTRLAAILLTVMYAAFGVLVHLPSVIASPSSHAGWGENAINLILVGSAWSLADWLSNPESPR